MLLGAGRAVTSMRCFGPNRCLDYNWVMNQTDLVLTERHGAVAHVILNRPERRNALTGPLADELLEALTTASEDDDVSIIVVRGAGGAFCSGLDLKEFSADPRPEWVAGFGQKWRAVHETIFNCPKIVVGALERAAVNGGAALALAMDFLVAGDNAFLQVGEIQQGMAAPMNTAWLLLRHSEAVAARAALIGDRLNGPKLVELGIALMSVADEHVVAETEALANRLAEHDRGGIYRIKTSLRGGGPSGGDATAWFDRAVAVDPLAGKSMRPIAARSD